MVKVLVVDDEPEYREHLGNVISSENHLVKTAADASDAPEIFRCFHPQILVVDWMLGDSICGLELASMFKEVNPRLLVIAITGYPGEELREKVEATEIFAFLEKPFRSEDIRETIREATRALQT